MTERILRPAEVDRVTGLSKSARYDMEARGLFPKRIKLSARSSGYLESEVEDWIQSRPRAESIDS